MKKIGLFLLLFFAVMATNAQKVNFYELRIYHCAEGKLPDLLNRFRNHTLALFEKHGMKNIGYFTSLANPNDLVYVLGYPSKVARETSWKSFSDDPEWQQVLKKSEENGKILTGIDSKFMTLKKDLTPKIKLKNNSENGVFEMRTYFCLPGKYPDLVARFKNHTLQIFKNHGMKNVMYFETIEEQPKLLYFLWHAGLAQAKSAWVAFKIDPDWIKTRDDSEKSGKIVEKVESVYLQATDFSKIK